MSLHPPDDDEQEEYAQIMQKKNELFPNAMEQFMSQFTKNDGIALVYALSGPSYRNDAWDLYIPYRICIGELTHGRHANEKLYRKQAVPSDKELHARFNSFFGRFALKNIHGETVAIVRLTSFIHEPNKNQLWIPIQIQYGTLDLQRCPFPMLPAQKILEASDIQLKFGALVDQNQLLEQELSNVQEELLRHATHMTTLMERWHTMWDMYHQQSQTRHGHIQGILRAWYADRPTREDCPVCWNAMAPTDLVVPRCGHFICVTCHGKCTKCPTCRHVFTETAAAVAAVATVASAADAEAEAEAEAAIGARV